MRARLASMIALTVLVGLGGGAVMTAAAGARRTDSAYRRFAKQYKAADLEVYPSFGSQFASLDFDKVAKLPQVVASAPLRYMSSTNDVLAIGHVPPYGTELDIPKVLSGRMPRPDAPDEAAVAFTLAKQRGLHVGSSLTIPLGSSEQPITRTLKVVGIEATPGEFPPAIGSFGSTPTSAVHVSEALYKEMSRRFGEFNSLLLRLRNGAADVPAVVTELGVMAGNKPHLEGKLDDQAADVQRSIHTQAVALWIVGALIALIGALVLSQLLARQAVLDSDDNPTLLALGMTRTQVWLTGMGRSVVIGLGGAVIGVAAAALASPLLPFGTARIAEPHPGFALDTTVLAGGALVIVAGICAFALWPVWKSTTMSARDRVRDKPSIVGRAAGTQALTPPIATGVRLALEPGRGRTEVPVRSSLFSVILAIAALASALTFGAGLSHLLATPRLYGWNWDLHITDDEEVPTNAPARKLIAAEANIQDAALVDTPPFSINGKVRVDGMAYEQVKGEIVPVISSGRAPARAGEIALGAKTLRDAHAHVGSVVHVGIAAINGPAVPLRVVGTVVLPPNSASARLGNGVIMTIDAERSMIPPGVTPPTITDFLVRFGPGVNKKAEVGVIAQKLGSTWETITPTRPSDLVNFGQVQNLPLVLAGLVALLAIATLAHTLITAIRRRRRDLAILKMLGFVPRQVRAAVAWQATTFVAVALLIGLPLGIASGRAIWTLFADQIGALAEPVFPSLQLLLTIPAAIILANAIAVLPAFIAARMKPAVVLRAE
jgi:ABC-type antimicrobial peptide transport system permease subunit